MLFNGQMVIFLQQLLMKFDIFVVHLSSSIKNIYQCFQCEQMLRLLTYCKSEFDTNFTFFKALILYNENYEN